MENHGNLFSFQFVHNWEEMSGEGWSVTCYVPRAGSHISISWFSRDTFFSRFTFFQLHFNYAAFFSCNLPQAGSFSVNPQTSNNMSSSYMNGHTMGGMSQGMVNPLHPMSRPMNGVNNSMPSGPMMNPSQWNGGAAPEFHQSGQGGGFSGQMGQNFPVSIFRI